MLRVDPKPMRVGLEPVCVILNPTHDQFTRMVTFLTQIPPARSTYKSHGPIELAFAALAKASPNTTRSESKG